MKKTIRRCVLLLLICCLLLEGCLSKRRPTATEPDAPGPEPTASVPASTAGTEPTAVPATTAGKPDPAADPALIRYRNGGMRDYLEDLPVDMVDFSEMEYARPDVAAMYRDFDALIEAAGTTDRAEELLEAYYKLYDRYVDFYTMDTLANVRYSLKTTDAFYKAEYDFCENETPNVEEKLEALNKALAASPARDQLEEEYFGSGYFEQYDDYEVYTNPEYLRLSQEEAALLSEYRALTADMQVSFQGETKPLDEWLETDDYYTYIGALQAYYDSYNTSVGELFVRLVKVRQQLAAALDYDSYADYSFDVTYTRDYSPEQGVEFLNGIRTHLVPVLEKAMPQFGVSSPSFGGASEQSVMEMVASAAQTIGGSVWDAYRFMRAYGLCDISRSPKKIEGSFQTYIYDYEAPFVLVNAKGSGEDYTTFAHEFGHFTDAYHNYGANEDLETAETFSQAMEFLALQYSDALSQRQRDSLLRYKLYDLLETFVYQGAYAEFEARVYALDPEKITVERINEIYLQCCKDFGVYEDGFDFYYSQGWIDVLHFFEVPYYVISYCVSAETALQVYELETRQKGDGVAAYFRLLDRDYSAGVQQVMEDAELESPFRDDVIEQTAEFFRKQLSLDRN